MKTKICFNILFLLGYVFTLFAQFPQPITEIPVPDPPLPAVVCPVPNNHHLSIVPRWTPSVMMHPEVHKDAGGNTLDITSKLISAGVVTDSKGVSYILGIGDTPVVSNFNNIFPKRTCNGFSAPEVISPPLSISVIQNNTVDLVIGNDDVIHGVWSGDYDFQLPGLTPVQDIYYRKRDNSGWGGTAVNLTNGQSISRDCGFLWDWEYAEQFLNPKVAVDAEGTVHIIFIKKTSISEICLQTPTYYYSIQYITIANGVVSPPDEIFTANDFESVNSIDLAVDDSGNPHIIFEKTLAQNPFENRIQLISQSNNWQPLTLSTASEVENPSVAVNREGNVVHAVWASKYSQPNGGIVYQSLLNGIPQSVEFVSTSPGKYPKIVLDRLGKPHVTWGFHSSGKISYAAKVDEIWGRQEPVPNEQTAFEASYPLSLSINDQNQISVIAANELGTALFHTQTTEFNLGSQYMNIPVAPNFSANAITGNLCGVIPLFSTKGRGFSTDVSLVHNSFYSNPTTILQKWMHNHHSYLVDSKMGLEGQIPGRKDVITLYKEDGSSCVFVFNPTYNAHIANAEHGEFSLLKRTETGYICTSKHGYKSEYDLAGRIISREDTNGNQLFYIYENGLLTKIIDSVERETLFYYDDNGNLIQITDPSEQHYFLTYDAGHLNQINFAGAPDGQTITWTFTNHIDYSPSTIDNVPDTYGFKDQIATIATPRGTLGDYHTNLYYSEKDGTFRAALQPEATYKEPDGSTVQDRAVIGMHIAGNLPGQLQTTTIRNPRGFNSLCSSNRRLCTPSLIIDESDFKSNFKFDNYRNLLTYIDQNESQWGFEYYPVTGTTHVGDNLHTITKPDADSSFTAWTYSYTDDGFNLPETIIDYEGNTTNIAYHENTCNVSCIDYPPATLPDGATENLSEKFFYDIFGEMTMCVGVKNDTTFYENLDIFTGLYQEIACPETSLNKICDFNIMGDLIGFQNADAGECTVVRNGLHLVESVTQHASDTEPLTMHIERDENLNVTSVFDDLFGEDDPYYEAIFDDLDRMVSQLNATEEEATFEFNRNDEIVCFTNFRDVTSINYPDERGFTVESITDASNPFESESQFCHQLFEFDGCGNMTQSVVVGENPNDSRTHNYEYDERYNLIQSNCEEELYCFAEYDCEDYRIECSVGTIDSDTIQLFTKTKFEWDELNRPFANEGFESNLTSEGLLGNDPENNLTDHILTTHFYHKDGGNHQIIQNPLGNQSGFLENGRYLPVNGLLHDGSTIVKNIYNDRNLLTELQIVNPNSGDLTTLVKNTFNDRNLLATQTDPFNNVIQHFYDKRGRRTTTIDEAGVKTETEYNELNQVTQVARAVGLSEESRTFYQNDVHGNVTKITVYNPETGLYNAAYTMVYDNADRLVKMTFPAVPGIPFENLSLEWRYDEFGNLIYFKDRNGKETTYQYDKADRLIVEIHQSFANPDHLRRLEYKYDPANRLTEMIERSGISANSPEVYREENEYDGISRMTAQQWFIDGEPTPYQNLSFEYDKGSRLTAFEDEAGKRFEFIYNEDNWLIGISGPDATFVQFGYDKGGRRTDQWKGLTAFNDTLNATAHTVYKYDDEIQLIESTTRSNGEIINQFICHYDERGNRNKIEYTHLHAKVAFQYDALQRLTEEYWEAGTECNDFLADISPGADTDAHDFFPGVPNSGFPGRLKTYQGQYSWDPAGNRTEKTINGHLTTYIHDAQNRLMAAMPDGGTQISFIHDFNSNQIERIEGDIREKYGFDYNNRMTGYEKLNAGNSEQHFNYQYTPSGQRYGKQDLLNGSKDWFKYFGNDVYADYHQTSPADNIQLQHFYLNGLGIDSKSARISYDDAGNMNDRHWFLTDPLGSNHQLLNDAGQVENLHLTDAWGVPMPEDFMATAQTSFDRYTGLAQREIDAESGLQYTRERHYDNETGRFLGQDKILGNMVGEHFGYASGNPVMRSDATGLEPEIQRFREEDVHFGNHLRVSTIHCHGQNYYHEDLYGLNPTLGPIDYNKYLRVSRIKVSTPTEKDDITRAWEAGMSELHSGDPLYGCVFIGGALVQLVDKASDFIPNPKTVFKKVGKKTFRFCRNFFSKKGRKTAIQAAKGGVRFTPTSNKTTTILGRLGDTGPLRKSLGNVKSGMNEGGFNILNMPDKFYSWANNQKWLKRAIDRGDVIKAASQPTPANLFKNGVSGKRTIYGLEVEMLEKAGYRYDASTLSFIK